MKVIDLFTIKTGGDLWVENEEVGKIPVVSLSFENNGVVAYIKKNEEHELHPAGSITVSGWAGGMRAFVQVKDFYVRGRVKVLIPKHKLTLQEKLYYCCCFNANAYRYTYGRKSSGKRFSETNLPSLNEIPCWVKTKKIEKINTKNEKPLPLIKDNWQYYNLSSLFEVKRGKRLVIADREAGKTAFVTAGYINQGVSDYINNEEQKTYKNALTIDMFGNCFYRNYEFSCDDNILILLNQSYNKYVLLFISTIINQDKYRYSYGRQYRMRDFFQHKIKLPTVNNKVDVGYMEKFIKSLPYVDLI